MKLKQIITVIVLTFIGLTWVGVQAQEDNPFLPYKVAPQNLLKFNRFLINPTFSTVREDKSYVNLLHRNQSVQFQDNDQTYFLSYSGRIGDKSGIGLSLYSQKVGPVSNFGVLTNYAYGIKLSDKSNLTFGGNLAYYNSGLNINDIDVIDQNDSRLIGAKNNNILSVQPGINISYGQFDFGVFAENLFDYNLKTNKTISEFEAKTYSSHLQYTYRFNNSTGIFESARLMPLVRIKLSGQNNLTGETVQDISLGGSIILDLPKIGWLQGGYDNVYGASAGAGFNINKRFSLGYTMEKGFGTDLNNLGVTHEVSFAYSFTPYLTEDRVMLEDIKDDLVENSVFNKHDLNTNDEIEELKKKLAENNEIIAELMFREDSIESNRQKDLERRFNMVMRMVRNETNGERPDLEKRAENIFLNGKEKAIVKNRNNNIPNGIKNKAQRIKHVKRTSKKPTRDKTFVVQDKTKNIARKTIQNNAVKSRKFKNLNNVKDGYYLVANVYKAKKYMNKFINTMNDKGFQSNYIDNPNNGLKYVYLDRYDTWQEAVEVYKNNMNGTYTEELWVMNVDNLYTNKDYANNVDKLKQISSKYTTDVLQQNVVAKDKLAANKVTSKTYIIDGIESRYYIIANVFANPNNAKRFIKLLNSYGLSASYFINPENNWRYVYLKQHESWNHALLSYYTKLNDSYDDKMWIMRVKSEAVA